MLQSTSYRYSTAGLSTNKEHIWRPKLKNMWEFFDLSRPTRKYTWKRGPLKKNIETTVKSTVKKKQKKFTGKFYQNIQVNLDPKQSSTLFLTSCLESHTSANLRYLIKVYLKMSCGQQYRRLLKSTKCSISSFRILISNPTWVFYSVWPGDKKNSQVSCRYWKLNAISRNPPK